jgi:hypothetical protein
MQLVSGEPGSDDVQNTISKEAICPDRVPLIADCHAAQAANNLDWLRWTGCPGKMGYSKHRQTTGTEAGRLKEILGIVMSPVLPI